MPLYDVKCAKCGEIKDIWAKITETEANCPICGDKTERLISATRIICDLEPYFDENLAHPVKSPHGQWVMSRQDKRAKLKEQNLIESG
jgi:putative FmdB family regulatory protein